MLATDTQQQLGFRILSDDRVVTEDASVATASFRPLVGIIFVHF